MAPTAPAGADVSGVNREMNSEGRPTEAARHDVVQVIELAATTTDSKFADAPSRAPASDPSIGAVSAAATQVIAAAQPDVLAAGGQVVQLEEVQAPQAGSAANDGADIAAALENLALDDDGSSDASATAAAPADGSCDSSSATSRAEAAAKLTSHGPQHGRPVYSSGYAIYGPSGVAAAVSQQPLMRPVFRYDERELQLSSAAAQPQTKRSAPIEDDAGSMFCQANLASKFRYGGPTEDDEDAAYDDGFGGERLPSDDLGRLLRTLQPAGAPLLLPQQRQRFGSETTEGSWDLADSPYSAATNAPSPASSLGSAAGPAVTAYGQASGLSPFAYSCDDSQADSPQSWPPSPPAPPRQQQLLQTGSKQPDLRSSHDWPATACAYPARAAVPAAQPYTGFGSSSSSGSCFVQYGGSSSCGSGGGCVDLAAIDLPTDELIGCGDAQVPTFLRSPAFTGTLYGSDADTCSLYGEPSWGSNSCMKQLCSDSKPSSTGPEDALSEQFEIIHQVIEEDLLRSARLREQAGPMSTQRQQQQPSYSVTGPPQPVPTLLQSNGAAPKQPQQQQPQRLQQPMMMQTQHTLPSSRATQQIMQLVQPQVVQAMPATSPSSSPTLVPTTVSTVACNGAVQQTAPVILIVQSSPALPTSPPVAPARRPKERLILPRDMSTTTTSCSPASNPVDQPKAKAKACTEDAANKANGPSLENRLLSARRAIAAIPDNDLRHQDGEGNTYLHRVILKPDAYLVRAILERLYRSESMRGMVNLTNKAGQTAVYLATVKNHKLIVELLVQCNADVNIHALCPEFQAPLHYAASHGERTLDVLHCLLKARFIDLNIKMGNNGRTPLHCAILSHRRADTETNSSMNAIGTVRALLAAGTRLDLQDEVDGCSPLHHAIASGCFELVREVVNTASVPSVDSALRTVTRQGDTCLHVAAALRPASMPAVADRTAILHLLLKHGARTTALNLKRQRPVDLLLPQDDAEIKRLME